MKKLIKRIQKNLGLISVIALVLTLSVGATVSALSIPTNQTFTGEIKNLVINNPVGEVLGEVFGGSTSDDWNVGGNLAVTGTATLTGTATVVNLDATDGAVGGFTQGNGTFASTTTGGVGTLTEADLLDNSIIDILSNVDTSFALTLPATSTMTTLLPTAGDMRSWWIQNASSTAAVAITITKGAGIDLIGVDANVDVIDGAEWAEMNCYRKVDTDVVCKLNELVHAD